MPTSNETTALLHGPTPGGPTDEKNIEQMKAVALALQSTLDASTNAKFKESGKTLLEELRGLEETPANIKQATQIMQETDALIQLVEAEQPNSNTILQQSQDYLKTAKQAPGQPETAKKIAGAMTVIACAAIFVAGFAAVVAGTALSAIIPVLIPITFYAILPTALINTAACAATAIYGAGLFAGGMRKGASRAMYDIAKEAQKPPAPTPKATLNFS